MASGISNITVSPNSTFTSIVTDVMEYFLTSSDRDHTDPTALDHISAEAADVSTISAGGISTGDEIGLYHRYIATSVSLLGGVVGITGNVLVLLAVLLSSQLQTVTNIFVVNLALADLLSSAGFPFQSVGLLSPSGWPGPPVICKVLAFLPNISILCSVFNICIIAVDRCYVITKSVHGRQGIHTTRNALTLAAVTWIIPIGLCLWLEFSGAAYFGYHTFYRLCTVINIRPIFLDYDSSLIGGGLCIIALTVTVGLYTRILVFAVRTNRRFKSEFSETVSRQSAKSSPKPVLDKREIEITKNLFVVVCVYALTSLPIGVLFALPGTRAFTIHAVLFAYASCVVNPLIYGFKHIHFQKVFCCILTCNLAEIPQPSKFLRSRLLSTVV